MDTTTANVDQTMAETSPAKYALFDQRFLPLPFGLNNTGYICWLNATLQALLSCPAMTQTVLSVADDLTNSFAREYLRLVYSIIEAKKNPANWNPNLYGQASSKILQAFIECAKAKYPMTPIGNNQECADEAFTIMIDLFDHPKIANLFNNVYELRITCPQCNNVVSSVRDRTYKIDVFTQHSLADQRSFIDFLRFHRSPVDDYQCPNCGRSSSVRREERLAMLREIVVLTFNKYQAKDIRYFPDELWFPQIGGGRLVYRQVAQIEHSGSQSSGHYYADVLRNTLQPGGDIAPAAEFYRANDSSISPNKPRSTANTYMVIYHMASA